MNLLLKENYPKSLMPLCPGSGETGALSSQREHGHDPEVHLYHLEAGGGDSLTLGTRGSFGVRVNVVQGVLGAVG